MVTMFKYGLQHVLWKTIKWTKMHASTIINNCLEVFIPAPIGMCVLYYMYVSSVRMCMCVCICMQRAVKNHLTMKLHKCFEKVSTTVCNNTKAECNVMSAWSKDKNIVTNKDKTSSV